jgi:hypothetical protein
MVKVHRSVRRSLRIIDEAYHSPEGIVFGPLENRCLLFYQVYR